MERNFVERCGILSEDQARPIFEPYLPGMIGDFHDAFAWVQNILEQDTDRRATLDTSTVAAMVFDRFVKLFSRRHNDNTDVDMRRHGRMMRALIGERKIALRFKKLTKKIDGQLCSGNVKTNAQSLIYYQLGFDGIDARPTELTFGYTTDALNTEVSGLYITCPISWRNNKWVATLEGEELAGTLPFAVPTEPNTTTIDQAKVLITSKDQKKKAEHG